MFHIRIRKELQRGYFTMNYESIHLSSMYLKDIIRNKNWAASL